MIHHIVCFRFREGVTGGQIGVAGDALLGMLGRIPEIRSIRWGPNLSPSAGEYSHVLIVALEDMGAVERYLDHPFHQQVVAEHLAPIRDSRLAIDVEF
ncbi:MAG TPA: Dabb family protein [Gemmatimonadales bacterium]|nr:Dabb family protein [Gemmatimonadales bacterium]